MSKIVDALKALGAKCNTSKETPAGNTIAEVIGNIAESFDITGDKGDTGATGASVTAIALITTEGAVTGGTATLSNGNTIEITVTEANDSAENGTD